MAYTTQNYNKGTGLSFLPYSFKYDILTLKSQFTTINTNYTATSNVFDTHLINYFDTSNLTDNLRSSYSNLKINGSNIGVYLKSNLIIDNVSKTMPSLILNNGDMDPLNVNRTQLNLYWKYNDEFLYNHYIRTLHSATYYNNRIDFLVCDSTARNSLSSGVSNVLTLNGAGCVGIGTTWPQYNLDLVGTSRISSNLTLGNNIIVNHNNTEPALSLKNGENYTSWTRPQIKFSYNGADEYNHYIHTSHSSTTSRARIDFLVCSGAILNSLTTNTANVMSLVGNSRVGIGTTAPAYNLDVVGTGNFSGNISSANFSGTTTFSDPTAIYGSLNITGTESSLYLGYVINNESGYINSSTYTGIYDFTYSQWAFYQKRSTGQTIFTGGNVGIGHTNPICKLQLSTDSAGKPGTNTWTIVSDSRLKTNIQVADYDRCYNIMSLLDLKKYRWRDDIEELSSEYVKGRSKLGWIADDSFLKQLM